MGKRRIRVRTGYPFKVLWSRWPWAVRAEPDVSWSPRPADCWWAYSTEVTWQVWAAVYPSVRPPISWRWPTRVASCPDTRAPRPLRRRIWRHRRPPPRPRPPVRRRRWCCHSCCPSRSALPLRDQGHRTRTIGSHCVVDGSDRRTTVVTATHRHWR